MDKTLILAEKSGNIAIIWPDNRGKLPVFEGFVSHNFFNVKPQKKTFEITLSGDWYEDEQKMLGEGVYIEEKK